ncbi:RhoGAP domain-containing protein/PBD domain-containing protein [Cephalotus follicularis]|uniref:RhoGAP domain-containing protein/PBD domain-containing protein n=1 Tax=Cephalotus follicularis TaxID=3775 RepID=A0A1Q3AND0_CEPFO|nr:RhoGAP domain-containing protein/PBD domain-containing protein [Cephalotus follicularis]
MTEVLQSSPSHHHFPSSSSSSSPTTTPCAYNDDNRSTNLHHALINSDNLITDQEEEEEEAERGTKEREKEGDQLSILTLLVAAFRRSLIGCSVAAINCEELGPCSMEIGLPTNVRHVAHVTFDRFNGFLGLPVEFEPEVPRRAPSASASVFGVSTESMQLSFDSRGNSVPTILLLMQRHLYAEGGLQAEGIFRINAENSQEEYVRDKLNRGEVPNGIDVHCLAGLIKAWFRELPSGVLDSFSPEQIMQSQTEEECTQLVRLLPPTEASLLDWALNLMADVAQLENLNKMNARNVAMVFAPNMTQMSDPLTALMHAVRMMNFLKTLIIKKLREREDFVVESNTVSPLEPSDENGHQSYLQPYLQDANEKSEEEKDFVPEEPALESTSHPSQDDFTTGSGSQNFLISIENIIPAGNQSLIGNCPCDVSQVNSLTNGHQHGVCTTTNGGVQTNIRNGKTAQSSNLNLKKVSKKVNERLKGRAAGPAEKSKGIGQCRINARSELVEAWR